MNDIKLAKKEAIKTAVQLCYPRLIIEKIKNAKSESEIIRIMTTSRKFMED